MIYVWTFFLLFGDFLDARECQRVCGRVDDTSEQDDREAWVRRSGRNGTKILHGWDVPDRGFVVLIRAYDPKNHEKYETCQGALQEYSRSFEDVSSNTVIYFRGIPKEFRGNMTVLLEISDKDPLYSHCYQVKH